MYSCYATLDRNCSARTPAITSNTKYLSPLNSVYNNMCTQMLVYPGQGNSFTTRAADIAGAVTEPEHIKAFNIKTENLIPEIESRLKCKTCG